MRTITLKREKSTLKKLFTVAILQFILFSTAKTQAQHTATVNGVVAANEYGSHVNGNNQQSNGAPTTFLTWDATNLYVAVTNANTSEAFVLYLDKDPQPLVNGGTDANGTNVGFNYDGTNFAALQFRADIVLYVKNGYREYRTANGSNDWNGSVSGFGSYSETGGNTREFSIPWSVIGGKPSSFNFFTYITSSGGFVYGETPTENGQGFIGTSARFERYYTVSSTLLGSETLPFSRNSYVFNQTANATGFGAINVWDFTMNSSFFISRTGNTAGNWNIDGNLNIGNGIIYLGSGGPTYGNTNVSGNLNILGGTLNMDVTNKPLNISGNITNNGTLTLSSALGGDLNVGGNFTNNSTFNANSRLVAFNGSVAQNVSGSSSSTFPYFSASNTSLNPVSITVPANISISGTITSGILLLTNSTNTYSGTTTVTGGEFRLNPTSTTATFASPIQLNGGTLGTTGINSGTTFTSSSTLDLDENSIIQLGSNGHAVSFANSNAATWTSGKTLTIYGWTGIAGASGTGGKLFFGSDATGLTTAQLNAIDFDGFSGKAILLSTGELVPSSVMVTSFSPLDGYSGTTVTIIGTNFTGVTAVSFGGIAAASFTFISDTEIQAVVGTGASGSVSVTSPAGTGFRTGFIYNSGYVTKQDGDYNTPATWLLNAVPPAAANVLILHDVTLAAAATNIVNSVTIDSGKSLTFTTVSSAITTTNITNNGTFTTGLGLVNMNGTGTISGSNPITFNNISINGTVTLSTIPTINGTFTINGGNVSAAPIYGNASTLLYNTGGPYGVHFEWTGNATNAGTGVPQNVTIGNSTTLTMQNTSRGLAGNLHINSGTLILNAALNADLYVAGNWTRNTSATFTPSGRAVFFNGSTTQIVSVTGGGTETFNYLHINGSGNMQLASNTDIVVNTSSGLTLASSNTTSNLDLNGRTCTLSGGGNLYVGSVNRKITSTVAGGILKITSAITTVNGSGTGFLSFEPNTILLLEQGFNCASGANRTVINGTLELRTNGYVHLNAPIYGNSSLLLYKTGSVYDRKVEWNRDLESSDLFGKPHHVQISSFGTPTTINYPFGVPGPLGMSGNLTIDAGCKLLMDYGSIDCNGPLTVAGNLISAGEMTLGTDTGNDLKVGGDITFNTGYSFDAKNRAVYCIKNGIQSITAPVSSPPTFHYLVFEPSSGSTSFQLNTDLAITSPNGGNVVSFSSANDILDINGKQLTLGKDGFGNTIFGNGTFKGSTSSALTLLGNGSIGTVRFTESFRDLGTLTISRQNATTAMDLGTDLSINSSLVLSKGHIFLGTNNLTLSLAASHTGASANSYVIADATTTGKFRKNINGATGSFIFPIGDKTDSADGSNYSPATLNFSGGDYSSSAYIALAVNDSKHPSIDASATNFITRFWKLTSAGISESPSYSFTGTYITADITGTESSSTAGRWNGSEWTAGSTIASNTLSFSTTIGTESGSINEISAGNPLGFPLINVKGNDVTISNGDTTPSSADYTDFGNQPSTRSSTFLIENLPAAKAPLEISSVLISGDHPSDFIPVLYPASSVSVGGTTYLVVKFSPSGEGERKAIITINNNDDTQNPYIFHVKGQGIDYVECGFGTQETIAKQDFEDMPFAPALSYSVIGTATVAGGTGFAASSDDGTTNKFIGAKSIQINNTTAEIIFDAIDTSLLSEANFSFQLAAFSNASGANGMDAEDYVKVSVSKDGGLSWLDQVEIKGNSNAKWSFANGIGIANTVYDGNTVIENKYAPKSGGYRTTDGYGLVQINHLPVQNNLQIKITAYNTNASANEVWVIDEVALKGKRKSTKTWNGSAWSGVTPPTATDAVIIAGNYDSQIVGSGFNGCECEVASGAFLTVASTHHLDIQSDFKSAGTIVFNDSSSLLQHNKNAVNTATITMKRNTTPVFRYDFTYWSSPLTLDSNFKLGTDVNSLSPVTLLDKFYSWNHFASSWQTILNGNQVMIPGEGYAVRAPQSYPIEGSGLPAQIYTANFIGKPNNGDVSIMVSGSTVPGEEKWNLLGNPYPSAIDIEKFLTDNNTRLDGTIYLWNHNTQVTATGTGNYAYSSTDYATYNFTGSTATTSGGSGSVIPTKHLGTGQGFFVKGIANGTVLFNNKVRVAGLNNQFFRSNTETFDKNRIWLNISNQNAFNQTLVGYVANATNDLDWGFDGDHFGGNQTILYSIVSNKNLAIQGRALPFSNQDIVPLGYKTNVAGSLRISLDHFDGLFESQEIYLQDLLLNVIHNLKTSDYIFTTASGTFNNRFLLRYTPQQALANPDFEQVNAGVIISKAKNELHIKSLFENISSVTVYDIMGRTVFVHEKVNNTVFKTTDIMHDQQILIVKVQLANATIVTKKILY